VFISFLMYGNRNLLLSFYPGDLVTKAQGDLKEPVGRPCDEGQLTSVDPEQRVIGLLLYDGLLKVCVCVLCEFAVFCIFSTFWQPWT